MPKRDEPSRAPAKGRASGSSAKGKASPKTSARAASGRASTGKSAAKKPAAARSAAKGSARAAAPRKRAATKKGAAPRREELEPLDLDGLELDATGGLDAATETEDEPDTEDVSGGPLIAGPFIDDGDRADLGPVPQPMVLRVDDGAPPVDEEGPIGIERPRDELIAAGLAVLLAASVFLPWFERTRSVSGFSAGLWGPVIFFLSLSVVAIVLLRKRGVPVSTPVDHSAYIEGIGYVAILGLLASRLWGVEVEGVKYPTTRMLWIPIVLAVALAFIAGRISTGSPFVLRPDWFRGSGGKAGTTIIALALIGGIAFGMTGSPSTGVPTARSNTKTYQGKLPPCATAADFPVPEGVKLGLSYQIGEDTCSITFTSQMSLSKLVAAYRKGLNANGWKYKVNSVKGATTMELTKPRCGTLTLTEQVPQADRSAPDARFGISYFLPTCPTGSAGTGDNSQPPN